METLCSIKHKILQNSRFQIRAGENWVPVEKRDYESGAWQRRVKLSITVATLSKFTSLPKISK